MVVREVLHASVAEHSRVQGLPAHMARWSPSHAAGFALLNNSMSRAVLQRVFHRLFVVSLAVTEIIQP